MFHRPSAEEVQSFFGRWNGACQKAGHAWKSQILCLGFITSHTYVSLVSTQVTPMDDLPLPSASTNPYGRTDSEEMLKHEFTIVPHNKPIMIYIHSNKFHPWGE